MEKVDWHKNDIIDDTVITDSYKTTQNVRRYFKSKFGEAFKFDRDFMQWMKSSAGLTMDDACQEWMRHQRIIEVIDYQAQWLVDFAKEKELLSSVLTSANLHAIHHIGSTSVKGLCAKPIIDILLEVNSLEALDSESEKMASRGYLVKGECGIKGRRYFQKGGIQRTHQVHAFLADSPEAKRHLAFRDYLRAFPDVACKYGEIKRHGAAICNNDVDVYIDYKNGFIKEYEAKALQRKLT